MCGVSSRLPLRLDVGQKRSGRPRQFNIYSLLICVSSIDVDKTVSNTKERIRKIQLVFKNIKYGEGEEA